VEDGAEDKRGRTGARMVTQRKVLTFIAEHTEKGRGVSAHALSNEFWLSLSLAGC